MKKIFFISAVIAALSSCSNQVEEALVDNGVTEDGAVSFDVYSGRTTRASETTVASVQAGGFGVFAYEQGTALWETYRATNTFPNFMYNQKVACKVATWNLKASITPAQYTALGSDAATYYDAEVAGAHAVKAAGTGIATATFDGLSDAVKALGEPATYTAGSWDYTPHKYFSNNEGAKHSFFAYAPYQEGVKAVFSKTMTGPAIRYNAADNYDLVWGSKTGSVDPNIFANVDLGKLKVSTTTPEKVDITFKHALSNVSFQVCYFNDEVHTSHAGGLNLKDTKTTITVRSVKFIGNVPSQGLLSLYNGKWTYEATNSSSYEAVSEDGTPVVFTWDNTDDKANVYKDLRQNMMVIPTLAGEPLQIEITYDIETIDENNPQNSSLITNTVISETTGGYQLEAGKKYNFKLDLGITSVKFSAEVDDWTPPAGTDTSVDLPNNE